MEKHKAGLPLSDFEQRMMRIEDPWVDALCVVDDFVSIGDDLYIRRELHADYLAKQP